MKKLLSIALLLCAGLVMSAQQLPGDPAVRKGTLENGLTYYIVHNEIPAQRAEFYLATNVGAIQETPDQDGLAHFLEHMCFNGTKNFPDKAILDYLQSIGASFGANVNAMTGVEETTYMLSNIPLQSESVVDSCLLILHDYSHFVTCDPVEIDKERGVIIEERRHRRDASWRMNEQTKPFMYGDTKYAACSLFGSQENLETFKPESLTNFYHTWYRPDLQAVVVVGDVDPAAVEAKIASIWSDIPAVENPQPKAEIRIPHNDEPLVGIVTDPEFSALNVAFYWKKDIESEADNNTAMKFVDDLMSDIVSNAMAERFSELKSEPDTPLNDAVFGMQNICETSDAAYLVVAGKEGEWEKTAVIAVTEAERLRRYGLSDSEVERAKANILSAYEAAAAKASTRKNGELVSPLLNSFFDNHDYMAPGDKYNFVKTIVPQLQTAMINAKAKEMITDDNMVVLYYASGREGLSHPDADALKSLISKVKTSEIAQKEEKEIAADFIDPETLQGSEIKKELQTVNGATELKLKNGATVVLLPTEYEKDKIAISLFKRGGKSLIADADMPSFEDNIWQIFQMNQGVSSFAPADIQKMMSGRTVAVSPYISQYFHGIKGAAVKKDIEAALQLVYLYYCDPRFDANEFNQGVNMIRPALASLESQPQWQFQKQAIRTLYGEGPRHLILNEDILDSASLETMSRVYGSLFNDAAGLVAIIVGDFSCDEIKPLVSKYIGSIPKGKKALKWGVVDDVIRTGTVENDFSVKMETPKVTVSQVYSLIAPFTARRDAIFDALRYILNMIYTDTLREEEGGTYGAQVTVSLGDMPTNQDLLEIDFETNSESADKLRALARAGLETIASEGPSADYFDKAVKNLQKEVPENRVRNAYWMAGIELWYKYGIDYLSEYEGCIETLKPEDIRDAARSMVESGNFIELIMRPEQTEK